MANCNVCGSDYGYWRGRDPENQIYECFVCNGIGERGANGLGEIESILVNEASVFSDVTTFANTVKNNAQAFHYRIDADIPVLLYAFVIEGIIKRFIEFYMEIKGGMGKKAIEKELGTKSISFICEGPNAKEDKREGIYEKHLGNKFSELVYEAGFRGFHGEWKALKEYRNDFVHNYKNYPLKDWKLMFWEPARKDYIIKLVNKLKDAEDNAEKAELEKKFHIKFKEYKETDTEKARLLTEEAFDVFIYLWNNYIKGAKKGK